MEYASVSQWTRDTPWRQGQVLGIDAVEALGVTHPEFPADSAVVVISHDCDLANDNLKAEPFVEVVIGRRVAAAKGDFAWGKSPRTLHLEYVQSCALVFIELVATDKVCIDKNLLAPFAPDSAYRLSPKSLSGLRHWLSVRYNRAAYPDQFVDRMKDVKLDEKLANRIRKYPAISTIFFDVDRGEERDHSDGSPYELSVILAYVPGDDPDVTFDQVSPAEDEIQRLFEERAYDAITETWKGIALRRCVLVSEDDLTVSQARMLSQWRLEHMSLRAKDDQPAPYGVRA